MEPAPFRTSRDSCQLAGGGAWHETPDQSRELPSASLPSTPLPERGARPPLMPLSDDVRRVQRVQGSNPVASRIDDRCHPAFVRLLPIPLLRSQLRFSASFHVLCRSKFCFWKRAPQPRNNQQQQHAESRGCREMSLGFSTLVDVISPHLTFELLTPPAAAKPACSLQL